MNTDETRPILAMLNGYWRSPDMTSEEVAAWVRELTSRSTAITPEEARAVIDRAVHSGAKYRPRPSEVLEGVQALRRRKKLMTPQLAPPKAPSPFEEDREGWLAAAASAKRCIVRPKGRV